MALSVINRNRIALLPFFLPGHVVWLYGGHLDQAAFLCRSFGVRAERPAGGADRRFFTARYIKGKLHLFVGMGRASKFAYAGLPGANRATAKSFPERPIASAPYKIHIIPRDNCIRFTIRRRDEMAFMAPFDRVGREHGIERRPARVKHLRVNGQEERMSRASKEATVSRCRYARHEEHKKRLHALLMACTFASPLRTRNGQSPDHFSRPLWQIKPERLTVGPNPFNMGLNSPRISLCPGRRPYGSPTGLGSDRFRPRAAFTLKSPNPRGALCRFRPTRLKPPFLFSSCSA